MFSSHVANELKYYVYRLIDPRNGETFYIGKGIGSRVFAHIKGEADANDDALSEKLIRIRQTRLDGFEVAHVIHRHGLDEKEAYEVEAALIDAFPEVTNQVGGRYSDERGLMHAQQIIERYEAEEAEFLHKALLISINKSAIEQEDIYAAVSFAWKIDPNKAAAAEFIMAEQQGVIVGVFTADKWLPATPENFPGREEYKEGRWGFIGRPAPEEIQTHYLRKRTPKRKRGAATPIRYVG